MYPAAAHCWVYVKGQQLALLLLYTCNSLWMGLMASLMLCCDITFPTASKAHGIHSSSKEDTDFLLCPFPQKQDGEGRDQITCVSLGIPRRVSSTLMLQLYSERGPPMSNYFPFVIQTCLDKLQGLHYEESF